MPGLNNMEKYSNISNLKVSKKLENFVQKELLKDLNIPSKVFWSKFDKAVHELAKINIELIKKREDFQKKIDEWHKKRKGENFNLNEYKKFLVEIGYLVKENENFKIKTKNLDSEISSIAGPQLVVPIMNERYALNAANARWVSLYDSLYGTDIIESEEGGSERYDPARGQEVIKYVREFLDEHIPIQGTSWKNISNLIVNNGNLVIYKNESDFKLKDYL